MGFENLHSILLIKITKIRTISCVIHGYFDTEKADNLPAQSEIDNKFTVLQSVLPNLPEWKPGLAEYWLRQTIPEPEPHFAA